MYERDWLKKKASETQRPDVWKAYKTKKLTVNKKVKKTKKDYYKHQIEGASGNLKATWKILNDLILNDLLLYCLGQYWLNVGRQSSKVAKQGRWCYYRCLTPKHSADIWHELGWLSLSEMRQHQMTLMMFKVNHGLCPSYFSDMFDVNTSRLGYDLRYSGMNLIVPKARTNYFRNSFASAGAKLWNSLPFSLKEETF